MSTKKTMQPLHLRFAAFFLFKCVIHQLLHLSVYFLYKWGRDLKMRILYAKQILHPKKPISCTLKESNFYLSYLIKAPFNGTIY